VLADAVFHELDLAFYNTRKDQCDIWLGFKEGKVEQVHYKEHQAGKERARVCKELDEQFAIKNADTTRVVTMDVQQLLLKLQFSSTKSIDNKTYKPVGDRFARSYLYATSMFLCLN